MLEDPHYHRKEFQVSTCQAEIVSTLPNSKAVPASANESDPNSQADEEKEAEEQKEEDEEEVEPELELVIGAVVGNYESHPVTPQAAKVTTKVTPQVAKVTPVKRESSSEQRAIKQR